MRPYCLACALKHVSQAVVLLAESKKGYPLHLWLAVGHLAEAEDELISEAKFLRIAEEIRVTRHSLVAGEGVNLLDILEVLNAEYQAG